MDTKYHDIYSVQHRGPGLEQEQNGNRIQQVNGSKALSDDWISNDNTDINKQKTLNKFAST
jgi:hypothetical protein